MQAGRIAWLNGNNFSNRALGQALARNQGNEESRANWDLINRDAFRLFGRDPAEIMNMCDDYADRSRKLKSPREQRMAYLQFMLSVRNN